MPTTMPTTTPAVTLVLLLGAVSALVGLDAVSVVELVAEAAVDETVDVIGDKLALDD